MKLVFQSISYFNNIRTFLVQFVLLPILQALLMVSLIQDYAGEFSIEIMTASLLVSSATMAQSIISNLFVSDINRGVDKLLIIQQPYSLYYWGTRISVTFIAAYVMIIMNTLFLGMFHLVQADKLFLAAPIMIGYGIIIGLTASFLSWTYENPYFWSNLMGSFMTIFSGAIGAVSLFPSLFKELTYLLPFGRTLEYIHLGQGNWWIDALIAGIWLVIMLVVYRYQMHQITKKHRHSSF